MSKSLHNFVIGLGVMLILVAIYGAFKEDHIAYTLSGIVVGVSLIWGVTYKNNKR